MSSVEGSLSLYAIFDDLEYDKNIFWYVNRNGIIRKLEIEHVKPSFYQNKNISPRDYFLTIDVYNISYNKGEDRIVDMFGLFYDNKIKQGHIFNSRLLAGKYIVKRVRLNHKSLSKKATIFLQHYPEFLI